MRTTLGLFLILTLAVRAQDPVLAPGNPPLTRSMVTGTLAVLEKFLELTFTPEQRDQWQQAIVAKWKRGDKVAIDSVTEDLKYLGNDDSLRAARESNEAGFVEGLRKDSRDPEAAVLLAAYDAAHPDRAPVMQARGMGRLVGEWKTQGAILPNRDPNTGRLRGISATDSQLLNIYSDGRFHYLWSHSHCDSGNTCCRQYGSSADGTLSANGPKLVLESTSGHEMSKNPCLASANMFQATAPHREAFDWSLDSDPRTRTPRLCLSGQPFNPQWNGPSHAVCYLKQR